MADPILEECLSKLKAISAVNSRRQEDRRQETWGALRQAEQVIRQDLGLLKGYKQTDMEGLLGLVVERSKKNILKNRAKAMLKLFLGSPAWLAAAKASAELLPALQVMFEDCPDLLQQLALDAPEEPEDLFVGLDAGSAAWMDGTAEDTDIMDGMSSPKAREESELRCLPSLEVLQETVAPAQVLAAQSMTTLSSLEAVQLLHKESEASTQQLLARLPSGADDTNFLPHLLKAVAGEQLVTFGSGRASNVGDPLHMMHSITQFEDSAGAEWMLTLDAPPSWSAASSVRDLLQDSTALQAFREEAKRRIARSLLVGPDRVQITSIKEGSVKVKFTVSGLTRAEKKNILNTDVTGKLRQDFSTFQSFMISPAILALNFNLSDLDERGNKDFSTSGSTFQVGGRPYHQPCGGWIRYGISVLENYSDDTWLHPFQHANNWCRGFHGLRTPTVAKKITSGGFNASPSGKLGLGVYTSPFVDYSEMYAGHLPVQTTSGVKNFKVILQVAVRPGGVMKEGYPTGNRENQEWTVQPADVRPYGLLIKEQP